MSVCKLSTPWAEKVGETPLQEYPRPQFRRDSYFNLNGKWNYAITKKEFEPTSFDGEILVPFSPESALSGVGRQLQPNEFLWYSREFVLPENFNRGVVLLHFGAVDTICDVFLNNKYVCRHTGGYNAFSADVTRLLRDGVNKLTVRVRDFSETKFHTTGKQCLHRRGMCKGMWYTPQSGIWQTVWMESVPQNHITDLKITPRFDDSVVLVEVKCSCDKPFRAVVSDGKNVVAQAEGKGLVLLHFSDGFRPWSPEDPFLYDLTLYMCDDKVQSYFGMRKFSTETVDGVVRLTLNNKPYFQNGVLDQGYWPDGLYTAPTDEAMVFDIRAMKDLGFNMIRKHIKVEPMRWYYHCDRLGMLVWQDMPSGGTRQRKLFTLILPHFGKQKISDRHRWIFSRKSKESRERFHKEYDEMIAQLYNCPCISVWVPFNEGWGQFDSVRIAQQTKVTDSTRLVDHASGWHDQGGGDFKSMHVYFKGVDFSNEESRATVLSEFGGYSYKDPQHSYDPAKTYAYKIFDTEQAFNDGLKELYERDVIANIDKGLCAAVYTQLSDVEEETNGFFTYDRKVLKVDPDMMRKLNAECVIKNTEEKH